MLVRQASNGGRAASALATFPAEHKSKKKKKTMRVSVDYYKSRNCHFVMTRVQQVLFSPAQVFRLK
jgi:hypothetical protein